MARTYDAIPPRVSVLVETHSARRSAMPLRQSLGDVADRGDVRAFVSVPTMSDCGLTPTLRVRWLVGGPKRPPQADG
jgi:hypothetical protein